MLGVSHLTRTYGELRAVDDVSFRVPAGQVYTAVESPKGELGCHLVSSGGTRPYRVHFRDPSFTNLQAVAAMSEGGMISDIIAAASSTRIIGSASWAKKRLTTDGFGGSASTLCPSRASRSSACACVSPSGVLSSACSVSADDCR